MNLPASLESPQAVKLTVGAFETLHRAGFLDNHRRAELIDGNITAMSPMGMQHSVVMTRLLVRLMEALRDLESDTTAMSAPTIAIPPFDAPEPDIVLAVLPEVGDGYVPIEAVAMVVEVSVSTLRHDLTTKRALFARSGLPEYWVVDVAAGQMHQFWSPDGGDYAERRVVPLSGQLRSATVPNLAIDGTGIL